MDSSSRDALVCSKVAEHRTIPARLPNPLRRKGMSSLPAGKHAGSGAASNQPAVAEPTFAERSRTLVYMGRVASLSTLSRKQQGFPFGSVMPYGLDDQANPVFLISTMAMHTQNVQADPRSSLLVASPMPSAIPWEHPGSRCWETFCPYPRRRRLEPGNSTWRVMP